MDSYKLSFKLFLKNSIAPTAHDLVPVFQKWIQAHAVADHLMIDVADYAHVPEGPGTMLITLEANFAMDNAGGKPGLLYVRKQPISNAETFSERLSAALRPLLDAAIRLETEPTLARKVEFRTDSVAFRIYDRLLAPNTPATFESVKPELGLFTAQLYGSPTELEYTPPSESIFEVTIKSKQSPRLSDFRDRLPATVSAS